MMRCPVTEGRPHNLAGRANASSMIDIRNALRRTLLSLVHDAERFWHEGKHWWQRYAAFSYAPPNMYRLPITEEERAHVA